MIYTLHTFLSGHRDLFSFYRCSFLDSKLLVRRLYCLQSVLVFWLTTTASRAHYIPFFLFIEDFFDIAIAACCAFFAGAAFLAVAFFIGFFMLPMQPQVAHITSSSFVVQLGQPHQSSLGRQLFQQFSSALVIVS